MKEHIKKFRNIAAADGHVIDAPFIASVAPATEGAAPLNIQCTEEGKKLSVSEGVISVVDSVRLISFTIDGTPYQAEEGMTWGKWVESEYNTGGFYLEEAKGWSNCIYNGSKYIVE